MTTWQYKFLNVILSFELKLAIITTNYYKSSFLITYLYSFMILLYFLEKVWEIISLHVNKVKVNISSILFYFLESTTAHIPVI